MRPLFLLFITCFALTGFTQASKESLLLSISRNPGDSRNFPAYQSLISFYRNDQPDSALFYARKAFDLEKLTKREKAIAALSVAAELQKDRILQNQYLDRAEPLIQELQDDSLHGALNYWLGLNYFRMSNYDVAIEKFLKSVTYFEKIRNTDGSIRSRMRIAEVYQEKGQVNSSERTLKELMQQKGLSHDQEVKIMHTLANIYGMQGRYEDALAIDEKGLELTKGMPFKTTPFYDNKANCFMYMGVYDSAEFYFRKCIPIDSALGDLRLNADTYLNLGNLFLRQKQYKPALENLEKAYALASRVQNKKGKLEIKKLMSQAYAADKNYELAFSNLKESYTIKDSVINEFTEARTKELEAIYENEKHQNTIKEINNNNKIRGIIIGGLISLLGLFAVLGYQFYRRKQAQNKLAMQEAMNEEQTKAAKSMIDAENRERERIAADLHDGLGQILSAAKLNLNAIEENQFDDNSEAFATLQKVEKLLGESIGEVKNLSYSMMPATLHELGLEQSLKNLASKFKTPERQVHVIIEGLDKKMSPDFELNIFRIAQESLNNAAKHSGANLIQLSLFKEKHNLSLVVEDNGKGIDKEKIFQSPGMGIKNILSRISFLKGNFEIDTAANGGTVIAVHIPLNT